VLRINQRGVAKAADAGNSCESPVPYPACGSAPACSASTSAAYRRQRMRATHARVPYRIHSGAGGTGPSKSLARCFRPGVVIATELRQRRPKPSTFRTLTPRHGGSEDQPLYGVARWLGRPWVDFTVLN